MWSIKGFLPVGYMDDTLEGSCNGFLVGYRDELLEWFKVGLLER